LARRAAADPERAEITYLDKVFPEEVKPERAAEGVAWEIARGQIAGWREERLAQKRDRRSEAPEGAQETPDGV
jgi:hypothetical protein